MTNEELGARIHSAREARRIDQQVVAAKLGVKYPFMSYVEAGKSPLPANKIGALARAVGWPAPTIGGWLLRVRMTKATAGLTPMSAGDRLAISLITRTRS